MTGILANSYGTLMPFIVGTELAKVQNKTAGTTNLNSGSINMVQGRVYLVMLAWDPSGASLPTVTLSDTANTYTSVRPLYQAPATTSAGTGVIIQAYTTMATNTATRTIAATFSASITAKCMVVLELANASTTLRSASDWVTRGTTTSVTNTNSGLVTGSATDVLISMIGWESPTAIVSGSTSTASGTWSAVSQINTTGGTANTNIGIAYQYKVLNNPLTAANTVWTTGATPNNWGTRAFYLRRG